MPMVSRWKRRKTRIAPLVDDYIRRRYEDLAVCIARDIVNNRGLLCYYTPWLDHMMGKFNLPLDYRARHSLVATDSEGRHIGCSGAAQNTLVYHNPISPGCEGEAQFQEAVTKSCLSARFKGYESREGWGKVAQCSGIHEATPICEDVMNTRFSDMQKDLPSSTEARPTECSSSHKGDAKPAEGDGTTRFAISRDTVFQDACPKYVTEDGVVHVVNELRPQSAARIDEAFCKHKASTSKPAVGVTDLATGSGTERNCEESSVDDEGRTLGKSEGNVNANNQRVAKSKFCTIL